MNRNNLIAIMSIMLSACTTHYTHHDEQLAARHALTFVQTAIISRDIDSAYSTVSDQMKTTISLETFRQAIAHMHPSGFPTTIQAVSYDFVPTKNPNVILINLLGKGANGEDFHYQVDLIGSKRTDYQIIGIGRFPKPIAFSKLGRMFPGGEYHGN